MILFMMKICLEVDLSSWSGLTINTIKNKYPEKYLLLEK